MKNWINDKKMQTIKLRKKICLRPNLFDNDLNVHLYDKLNKSLNGTCTRKDGYIISVDRKINVIDNEVTADGSILFDVEFTVHTLKPEKGQLLKGETCMIFQDGIFVEVENNMKVLVPSTKIDQLKFDKKSGTFKGKNKSICLGDNITVKVDQIRYDLSGFKIIGVLVV